MNSKPLTYQEAESLFNAQPITNVKIETLTKVPSFRTTQLRALLGACVSPDDVLPEQADQRGWPQCRCPVCKAIEAGSSSPNRDPPTILQTFKSRESVV